MDEKKFWNYFGHREAYSQDYRISITSFKFDCINCTHFFLFQFSEGFFSFVLEKNFGLEDMSPSLDCKGYLNGLIFNFKVIRISQEFSDFVHFSLSLAWETFFSMPTNYKTSEMPFKDTLRLFIRLTVSLQWCYVVLYITIIFSSMWLCAQSSTELEQTFSERDVCSAPCSGANQDTKYGHSMKA